jgi:hypothetical protein
VVKKEILIHARRRGLASDKTYLVVFSNKGTITCDANI